MTRVSTRTNRASRTGTARSRQEQKKHVDLVSILCSAFGL